MAYLSISIPLVLGWLAGWLINYLADVLPFTRRFSHPTCRHCEAEYPIGNYLRFAKCEKCTKPRGWRPIIVQVILMSLATYTWLNPPGGMGFTMGFVLLVYFGIVTIIDLEHRLIMHPVSLAGILLAFAAGLMRNGLIDTLLGGLAGLGIMGALYLGGVIFSKIRARKLGTDDEEEALGFGDVALSTVLGLALGWPLIWFGLLLGILLGGGMALLVIIGLFVTGKYKTLSFFLPYGPFLIASATLLLYFPNWITAALPK